MTTKKPTNMIGGGRKSKCSTPQSLTSREKRILATRKYPRIKCISPLSKPNGNRPGEWRNDWERPHYTNRCQCRPFRQPHVPYDDLNNCPGFEKVRKNMRHTYKRQNKETKGGTFKTRNETAPLFRKNATAPNLFHLYRPPHQNRQHFIPREKFFSANEEAPSEREDEEEQKKKK